MKHFPKMLTKLLVAAFALISVFGIQNTIAYLHTTTDPIVNHFELVELNTRLEETLGTDGTKQVSVSNIGKSNAYVRARIMVSGIETGKIRITTDANATASADELVLIMPNTGASGSWQKSVGASNEYSSDWFYYCAELPGENSGVQENQRVTSPLLQKVLFGQDLPVDQITITITHESVLAIPGDQKTPDAIEGVFNRHV